MTDDRASRRFRILATITAVYWCGMIVAMHSPLPETIAKPTFEHEDKLVHVVLYGLLAMLLSATVAAYRVVRGRTTSRWSTPLGIFGAIAVYGILDEATQPLTGRNFDLWDYAADLAAAAGGIAVFRALQKVRTISR